MSAIEHPSRGGAAVRSGTGADRRAPAQPEAGRRFQALLERAARGADSHDARGSVRRQVPDSDRDAEERPAAWHRSPSEPSDRDPSEPPTVPEDPSAATPQPDAVVVPPWSEFTGPAPSGSTDAPSTAAPTDRSASTDRPEIPPTSEPQVEHQSDEHCSALKDVLALAAMNSDARIEMQTPNLGRITINFSKGGSNPRFVVGVDPAFARSEDDMRRWLDDAVPGMSQMTEHAVVFLGPPAAPDDTDDPPSRWRRPVD